MDRMGRPFWHDPSLIARRERKTTMTKTMEVLNEAIRSTKHPFPKVGSMPKKAKKHRYERRKVNEYIKLGGLVSEEMI
jgi:hypothetical protein